MPDMLKAPLKPGDTIGIVGGGQLGRMLAISAARYGLKTIILEPGNDCPASQTASRHLCAAYDDLAAARKFCDECSVITYEFENIPLETINFLDENNILHPGPMALEKSQDRLTEKQFLNELSITTAPYQAIEKAEDIHNALMNLGSGCILKTRRLGYDGKGQVRLSHSASPADCANAFAEIGKVPAILEGLIDFSREISVILARSMSGEVAAFDPAENVHRQGILHTSAVPADISDMTRSRGIEIATSIAEALNYVGVLGVEFFVAEDESLVVNEIAPRVHNSGHWTEAACAVSQFDQHIRAISGWSIASPKRHSDCIMENLIGAYDDRLPELLNRTDTVVHLYGKTEARPGRKMGHFTTVAPKFR